MVSHVLVQGVKRMPIQCQHVLLHYQQVSLQEFKELLFQWAHCSTIALSQRSKKICPQQSRTVTCSSLRAGTVSSLRAREQYNVQEL